MNWILLAFIGLYVLQMLVFAIGFFRLKAFKTSEKAANTSFTIVVPFRNEAENLNALMQTILQLDYPKHLMVVIFVNDASDDASVEIIEDFIAKNNCKNWQVLENRRISGSPKKDAISLAISKAKGNWIFTTDADCVLPEKILKNLDAYIQSNSVKMLAGSVLAVSDKNNWISNYQQLESLTLAGVTMGAFGNGQPIMCNGAHLAYQKSAFEAVNGFEGNNHIASGDDLFLMEKIQLAFPGNVHFLKSKNHIVLTKTENSFQKMLAQRVRWAAKATGYKNRFSQLTGLLVFLANASVVLCYITLLLFGFELVFLMLILMKWLVDEVFLYVVNSFFKKEIPWFHLRIIAILYPIITIIISAKAIFGTYQWKGREFKK